MKRYLPLLACVLAFTLVTHSVHAQSLWNTTTGSWFVPGNWNPSGVPDTNIKAQINNGGTAQITTAGAAANTLTLGTAAGESGTLSVSGAGTLTVNGTTGFFFTVGEAGTGTLNVTGGGTVAPPLLWIGNQTGSVGTVTVSGVGSAINSPFNIDVGRSGQGTLNVLDGGSVSIASGPLNVGNGTGTGSVFITDSTGVATSLTANGTNIGGNTLGSTGDVEVSGTKASFTGGGVDVGSAGTGTLTVSGAATGKATTLTIGDAGTGTVTLTGPGTTFTVSGSTNPVKVGLGATGNLNIQAGATLTSNGGSIGLNPGGVGTVTITGTGSSWAFGNFNTILIGQSSGPGGSGTINVLNGGKITAANLNAFTSATLKIDGSGSQMSLPNDSPPNSSLFLGSSGTNKLDVTNGGALGTGSTKLGTVAGSSLAINVAGAGSAWTFTQFVGTLTTQFGGAGTATFVVSDHATVSYAQDGIFNVDATGVGTASLTVSSSGSFSPGTTSGTLRIGQDGAASLTIDSGGIVKTAHTYVGEDTGAVGTASLSGVGSTWNAGDLNVGILGGHGTVTVSAGATLTGDAVIGGSTAGNSGQMTVTDTGTNWNANPNSVFTNNFIFVEGNGSLTIKSGASVTATSLATQGNGSFVIQDSGTVVTHRGYTSTGTGTLQILMGAVVNGSSAGLSIAEGDNTSATVDGSGTKWTMTSSFDVGENGIGTLHIQNGAQVSNSQIYLGSFSNADHTGGQGTAVVTDAGSSWTDTSFLRVGDQGISGSLTIQNGATMTSVSGVGINNATMIGNAATATGTLTVTGAGSSWTNTGDVYIGRNGTGTLTTADKGSVSITGVANINATSTLNIGSGALAGTFSAASVVNNGLIHFNHTDTVTYSSPTSGPGAVTKDGSGTTIITGTHTYTGATTINAGLFQVDGTLGNTAISVANGATLGGVGSIGGPVTIQNGGILAPGDSPGTLTVASLILNSGSFLNYQLGTPGIVGGGVNDLTIVNGSLALDGTLNITGLAGFGAGTYRLFNYTGTLTGSTLSFGTLPAGFTASNLTIQTSVANQINLIVAAAAPSGQYWNGSHIIATAGVLGGTGIWNNGITNWTDSNGASPTNWQQGTAIFSAGTGTATLGADITATEIRFVSGAGAYTVAAAPGFKITLTGAGITNSSGVIQSFVTGVDGAGSFGAIFFHNNASAGTLTAFTNNGSTLGAGAVGGVTEFDNSSSAGSGTFTNNASSASGGNGGFTNFFDTATAGNATVINNASTVSGAIGGGTQFNNSATAGNANFTNNGPTLPGASGGTVQFFNTSTAGSGTFTNNGAGGTSGTFGGFVVFHDTSTAANGTFTDNGGTASGIVGGVTFFNDTASAGSGLFTNQGGTVSGALGGRVVFNNGSTAGSGTFTNNGGPVSGAQGSLTQFNNTSTASGGTFINNGVSLAGTGTGATQFNDNSTAGTGHFTNNGGTGGGGGATQFNGTSTAGSGIFTNNGAAATNAGPGGTSFSANATAGNGTFTNNPSAVSGGTPGQVSFFNSSTAGSGTFTSNGGTFALTNGGEIFFFNTSSAANGTFTNKGGTVLDAGGGSMTFNATATAGNGTFINNGGAVTGGLGGFIQFSNTSTAGSGTFTNNGGPTAGADSSGGTFFVDTTTAGSAHFTNNGATVSGADSGNTEFFTNSTAANGTFTNNGSTVSGADGGKTTFNQTAMAASGHFTSNGGQAPGANGGSTIFNDTTTAATGTFIVNGSISATGNGGTVVFNNSSTAANANITNNGTTSGGPGGWTIFNNSSNAGTATITNLIGVSNSFVGDGETHFLNSSSASSAHITNGASSVAGNAGYTRFYNNSTADNATIANLTGGHTAFYDSSTAGSATIQNDDQRRTAQGGTTFYNTSSASTATINNTKEGYLDFYDSSTAANAVVTNDGLSFVVFHNNSTAATATLTNVVLASEIHFMDSSTASHATVNNTNPVTNVYFQGNSTADHALLNNFNNMGFSGGSLFFTDLSTAANATIPNNGAIEFGGNATAGNATITNQNFGVVTFSGSSSGGSASIDNKSGGVVHLRWAATADGLTIANESGAQVDISDFLAATTPSVGVGSLSGAGNVFLGNRNLILGALNQNETISGVIADGGLFGGTGGSLTKTGTGTLTLTGINTYTGTTQVNAGMLQVDGTLANTATTVANGGTLGGVGSIGGPVTIQNGGILAPGDSPGTITVASMILNSSSVLNYQLGLPNVVGGGANDLTIVNGNITLDGVLNIASVGGFGAGTYRLFNYTGTLTDNTLTFGTLPVGFTSLNLSIQTSIAHEINLIVGGGVPLQYWDGPNMVANGVVDGGTGIWNNGSTNWTNAAGSTNTNWQQGVANFSAGSGTVSLGANISATELVFHSGSGVYTINTGTNTLTITGAGVTNNSGVAQHFIADVAGASGGQIIFNGSAVAGDSLTDYTTNGNPTLNGTGGQVIFNGTSRAGTATFTNNSGAAGLNTFGATYFHDHSSADHGTFINNGGLLTGGSTLFDGNSTADHATLIANPTGFVGFAGFSTAANATITVNGASGAVSNGGDLTTVENATLGNAIINNNGSNVNGGLGGEMEIVGSFGFGNATITNHGGNIAGGNGGNILLLGMTAGTAHVTNGSGAVAGANPGTIVISAGNGANATFINAGGSFSGNAGASLAIGAAATAGSSIIDNQGGTVSGALGGTTAIGDTSSAASASITNDGGTASGAGGGKTTFSATATAATATFTNNAGTVAGASGGSTQFIASSNAGTGVTPATFTNNGAAVAGTGSGNTQFFDTSSAGSATFIANGGTGGGQGGLMAFLGDSTGGTARFILGGNGALDISPHNTPGITTGSIEGSGNVFLGSRNLTVGNNNLSTTFSGVIADGGESGGTGGSFTKIGAGALNLSGINTYTGATNVNAGTLRVNGSLAAGSAVTVNNTATLGGSGHIFGPVTIMSGGTLAPGNSPGTLTVASLILNGGSKLAYELGTPNIVGSNVNDLTEVTGNLTLAGTLNVTPLSGFGAGVYRIFDYGGILTNNGLALGPVPQGLTFTIDLSTADQVNLDVAGVPIFSLSVAYWNGPHTTPNGRINGGSGIWTNTTTNWTDATGTVRGIWGGVTAIFAGAPGTVTLGDNIRFQNLNFVTNGYVIEGSRFSLIIPGASSITTNAGVTATIQASIVGPGSLSKNGPGTLNLTGASAIQGDTYINAGSLLVNGSLATPHLWVNPGGLLGGSGFVNGNVYNSGIVSPGNSPGTLHIGGNYVQTSGGALFIQIASAHSFDRLVINGHASLSGTLDLATGKGYKPQRGDSFTILTASDGISGHFGKVINPFPKGPGFLVYLGVDYTSNAVIVEALQNTFKNALSLFKLTPNQTSVAAALDSALFDARQNKVLDYLDNLDIATVPHQLDKIAPEELTSIFTLGFAQLDSEVLSVQQRLMDIRTAVRERHAPSPEEVRRAQISDKEPVSTQLPEDDHGGFFLTETGDFASAGDTYNANGFNIKTAGTTLGADLRLSDHFILGLTLGYERTDSDLIDGGHLRVDGGKVALYAMYHRGGFFSEGLLGGGYNSYDTSRSALNGTAYGHTDGGQLDAYYGIGYDKQVGPVVLTPLASLLYSLVGIQSFDEVGSLEPLHIDSQTESSLRSRLGLRVAHTDFVHSATVTSAFSAQWQHEFLDDELAIESRFANGAGDPFTVHGPRIGRDSALLTASVNVQWHIYAVYVAYQADLGRKDYENQTVLAGFRVSW